MEKAFVTPVILTKKQELLFEKYAIASRIIFNSALREHKNRYFRKKSKAFISGTSIKEIKIKQKQVTYTDFKNKHPWMFGKIPAVVLRDAVENCNDAMNNFFRRVKNGETPGYPKFKSRKSDLKFVNYQSDSINMIEKDNFISHINFNRNLGNIRLVRDNFIPYFKEKELVCLGKNNKQKHAGDPIQVAFHKKCGKWYCSLTIYVPDLKPKLKNTEIGIDVGSRTLAAVSNGKKYHPKSKVITSLEKTEKTLVRWQRKMSRRFQKGFTEQSKGWYESKAKVQKLFEKLTNIRKDVTNKISHKIVDHNPKRIVIENLNIQGMKSNKRLAPTLQKVGMYRLHQNIIYKSRWRGIKVQRADRFYPSSLLCSCCSNKKTRNELGSKEIYKCFKCDFEQNRDINAAINLVQIPKEQLTDLT